MLEALPLLDVNERPRVVFAGPDEGDGAALRRRVLSSASATGRSFAAGFQTSSSTVSCNCSRDRQPVALRGLRPVSRRESRAGVPTIATSIAPHLEIGGDALSPSPPGTRRHSQRSSAGCGTENYELHWRSEPSRARMTCPPASPGGPTSSSRRRAPRRRPRPCTTAPSVCARIRRSRRRRGSRRIHAPQRAAPRRSRARDPKPASGP